MPFKDKNAERAYRKRYAIENRDLIRQRARAYAATHKDEQKRRSRQWYEANKGRSREQAQAYVARDPEKWREYYRQYHQANRDRLKKLSDIWVANHPEKVRAMRHKSHVNRRARKRAAFVEPVDPAVVFKRARGKCGICMKRIDPASKWHLDHVIPLAKGGSHCYDNVQPAHEACNRSKCANVPKGQPTLFQVVTR